MSPKLRLEIIQDKARARGNKCQSSGMSYLRHKLGFAQIKAIVWVTVMNLKLDIFEKLGLEQSFFSSVGKLKHNLGTIFEALARYSFQPPVSTFVNNCNSIKILVTMAK